MISEKTKKTFFSRVEKTETCWVWRGFTSGKGYGHVGRYLAHRLSFEVHKGPIPPGLVVDHLCKKRNCVNPDHLRAVTNTQNVLENSLSGPALNKLKTHCPKGHPLSGENLFVSTDKTRRCRECTRATNKRTYDRNYATRWSKRAKRCQ